VFFGGEFGADEGLEGRGVEGGGQLAGADFLSQQVLAGGGGGGVVGGVYCDVAADVALDGREGDAAEDVEEAAEGFGGLEELGGEDRVVFVRVDGHVDVGPLAGQVEEGAAG